MLDLFETDVLINSVFNQLGITPEQGCQGEIREREENDKTLRTHCSHAERVWCIFSLSGSQKDPEKQVPLATSQEKLSQMDVQVPLGSRCGFIPVCQAPKTLHSGQTKRFFFSLTEGIQGAGQAEGGTG